MIMKKNSLKQNLMESMAMYGEYVRVMGNL